MKKTLAMLLALLLCLSLLPVSAMAEEGDVEVTVAGDTEVEGEITLRQALDAAADGCTVVVPEGIGNIALSSPLTVSKNVSIELNGQTVSAAFDANEVDPILATVIVAENTRLTLLGKGTVAAASDTDRNTPANAFGIFVKDSGYLTLTEEVGVTAADTTECLINLASHTVLELTTKADLSGGAAGVVAPTGATGYRVTIDMEGTIDSGIAVSLADDPQVTIRNASLKGRTRAMEASLSLRAMTADGYRAFRGTDIVPLPDEIFDAYPSSDIQFYTFRIPPVIYTVRYVSNMGGHEVPLGKEIVEAGKTPLGIVPELAGFSFRGWEPELGPVNADTTYAAKWVAVHTVTYLDGQGNTLRRDVVDHGMAAPDFGEPPTREGYTFKGWDNELPETITEDITLTAQWEIMTFTVTYEDGYEHILHTDTVAYGQAAPEYTDIPTREDLAFKGWDKELPAAITADVTLTATWGPFTFDVTYVDGLGNTLHKDTVEKGQAAPSYDEKPTRTGYLFKGWDKELPETITQDITITAIWEAEKRTVTYLDGLGNTLHTDTVDYDQPAPAYNVKPTREGYVFDGWDNTLPEKITENITLTAKWRILTHDVIYIDGLGNTLHTDTVEHGKAAPAYDGKPTRTGYLFKGWDKELPETITDNVILTALWEAEKRTVTYVDGQGKTLHTDTVDYGKPAPAYNVKPTREGFVFDGWDKTLPETITENITLTAKWRVLTHDVIYTDGQGKTLHTDTVEHGKAAPAYTEKPTRDGYTFKGWDKELPAAITADVTLTAQWEAVSVPTVTSRYPSRQTEKAADFYFTSSQTGYYYYLIFNPGAAVPSVDDLTVKGVSGSCQAGKETTVSLKNLSNADAKEVYIMIKNEAGVRSSIYRITIPSYFTPPTVTYTVTLNSGTGYTVRAASGSSSPVNAGGSFSFTVDVQNGYTRGSGFSVKANGVELAGNNGVYTISNIQANQNVIIAGVTAQQSNNGGGGGGYAPRPTVATPSVTTTTLPSAVMGQEYKQQLTAAGGAPITWSYTGTLPEGITLSSTGLLSGTPKAEGTFRFAVKVSNSAGSMTRQLSLVVAGNEYAVIRGNNSDWSQGTSDGITFQGSGQSAFTVRIDGSSVPASKLTLSQDGKSVTVSPEYLETLSTGSHTLTLVYPDGSARTKFNIHSTAKAVPPSISAQPMSSEVREGESVTFSVTASGTTPSFQWQVDTGDGKGWEEIPGATGSVYTVDGVTPDQTGWQYRCVITNAAGESESNGATLTVKEALGEVAADAGQHALKKSSIGKILLFSGLGLAAVGLAVGLVIYFRRRNDFMDD